MPMFSLKRPAGVAWHTAWRPAGRSMCFGTGIEMPVEDAVLRDCCDVCDRHRSLINSASGRRELAGHLCTYLRPPAEDCGLCCRLFGRAQNWQYPMWIHPQELLGLVGLCCSHGASSVSSRGYNGTMGPRLTPSRWPYGPFIDLMALYGVSNYRVDRMTILVDLPHPGPV
jgi:hypothetical protein